MSPTRTAKRCRSICWLSASHLRTSCLKRNAAAPQHLVPVYRPNRYLTFDQRQDRNACALNEAAAATGSGRHMPSTLQRFCARSAGLSDVFPEHLPISLNRDDVAGLLLSWSMSKTTPMASTTRPRNGKPRVPIAMEPFLTMHLIRRSRRLVTHTH